MPMAYMADLSAALQALRPIVAHPAASQFLSVGPNRLGNLAHQFQFLPLILF